MLKKNNTRCRRVFRHTIRVDRRGRSRRVRTPINFGKNKIKRQQIFKKKNTPSKIVSTRGRDREACYVVYRIIDRVKSRRLSDAGPHVPEKKNANGAYRASHGYTHEYSVCTPSPPHTLISCDTSWDNRISVVFFFFGFYYYLLTQ